MQLEIEKQALSKEDDKASKSRLDDQAEELANLRLKMTNSWLKWVKREKYDSRA